MRPEPLSPAQRRTFLLCFVVAMLDGFDTLVVAFIAPVLEQDWALDPARLGLLFGAGLLGAALGGFIGGPLADRFGRRRTLLGCVALFSVLTLVCAVAPDFTTLLVLRLLAGLGLGGAIPNITALTAENVPASRRSSLVTRMFIGFPLGAVVGGGICALMVPEVGWRSAFWLGGVLPLVLLPALWRHLPRSLAAAGAAAPAGAGAAIAGQFRDGRAAATLLLWLGAFGILLVSYFLINWTPMALSAAGLPTGWAVAGGVVLNLGGVVGALSMSLIIDRFGPFRCVGLALAAGSLAVLAMGLAVDHPVVLALLVPLVGFMVIGAQLNIPSMAAQLFPAAMRGTGVGWTMAAGRAGSILGPTLGGGLMATGMQWGVLFALVGLSAAIAAAALFVAGLKRPATA
ncbi:MFS transporter [Niveispirillum fermenti]|uniref:MFS transporter n=1 Tax=Niveispirillum fermenti TaxID=1233113 RepID=UPI003A870FEB